jgi:DNA-nicking Smr family endonuclease
VSEKHPGRRARSLSASERALWRLAMRDAAPLPGRELPPEVKPAPPPAPIEAALPRVALPPSRPLAPIHLPGRTYERAPGLDRRTSERLKRGQLPIEARLDLHGMTQDTAHAALNRFIADGARRGIRVVLIITGKGARPRTDLDPLWAEPGIGILKSAVPRWLNELPNRPRILAFTGARPEHGGGGALYVLLRRQRP